MLPCPVCGESSCKKVCNSGDYEYELPGTFYISECLGCGMIMQNPRPPFSDILRYYTEEYEPYGEVGSGVVQRVRHQVLVKPRIRLYQGLIGNRGDIVDIGCATGGLLRDLREQSGWTLHGIEPQQDAAKIAQDDGLNVIAEVLEEAHLCDETYDLAIMNHVLEHLPDPGLTTRHVYRILKPGAYFAGEIPTPIALERTIFGKYWGGYHLPRHLAFFGPDQIERFLRNQGFINITISGSIQPSNWLLSFSNLLRDRYPRIAQKNLFSPHNFLWLALSTPVSIIARLLGYYPILRFSAQKPH